ncbi:hypothetical protein Rxyl_2285 [Rubrobacter xylanophilus DSM 9941]|uniref:Uncharacterized protein n=1 Tax=Rubrobacter xylanophilus (strain DSM 9941 / JCM 11954 / NBRC 16129 / PRD-1) TaxID=266117 RepID=Q1ATR3_RUBXD|nr:hypothetical protein Rxyl_2285 [Rubrobacter xylanophilus DSM 9941]
MEIACAPLFSAAANTSVRSPPVPRWEQDFQVGSPARPSPSEPYRVEYGRVAYGVVAHEALSLPTEHHGARIIPAAALITLHAVQD